jgi:hypothetical protein
MDSEDLLQRARQERLLSDEENWFDNDDEEDKKGMVTVSVTSEHRLGGR